jgi:DNA-binding MarR family transcriptional regulator
MLGLMPVPEKEGRLTGSRGSEGPAALRRRLVTARLITLLKVLGGSASLAFWRETRLSGSDWYLIAQIGEYGPLAFTEIANRLRQDKGQASRAVKRLVNAGLLSREHLRAPIALTAAGKAAYGRIRRLAKTRNTTLLRELDAGERELLPRLIAKLLGNARTLLANAQALERGGTEPSRGADTEDALSRKSGNGLPTRDGIIAPQLITLQTLLHRSATATFKREIGLSDFDWRVMSQVGEHTPLTLIQLVPMLSRDKSQVGRAVVSLEGQGLITRTRIGNGRHILISTTERGRVVYDQLLQLALQRNAALLSGLNTQEQQALNTILDKLTSSAAAMLEQEQARPEARRAARRLPLP